MAIVSVVAAVATLGRATPLHAHGDPPQALSIVAVDDEGVSAIRLNEGLGLRHGKGFRYLCPALWGADNVSPALSIPDGPIVVGAASGLFLVDADGRVTRHPDPLAAHAISTLAASDDGLFALQSDAGNYTVLKVEADHVQVLWSGTDPWYDLAAGDGFLQLVGIDSEKVHEMRLSPSGEIQLRQEAPVPEGARSVLARVAGPHAYIVAFSATLAVQLGRIEDGEFVIVDSAMVLAGPIETDDGGLLIAQDQQLYSFDDERAEPLAETRRVSCLRRNVGVSYACIQGGLTVVDERGLHDSIFTLGDTLEPDLSIVPEDMRDACTLQWQRYQIDLISVGITPPGLADAGVAGSSGSAGADGAAGVPDGGAGDGAAKDAGSMPPREDDDGCRAAGPRASGGAIWFALAALFYLRRPRTDRQRPCRRRRTS